MLGISLKDDLKKKYALEISSSDLKIWRLAPDFQRILLF